MTLPEKKQFRQSVGGVNEHLLQLFEWLESATYNRENDDFDIALAKKQVTETGLVLLFELILQFFAERTLSPAIQLNKLLTQIQLLFERKQFSLCQQLIQKAKAIAEQHYLLQDLEKVFVFEKKIIEHQNAVVISPDERNRYYDQTQLYEQLTNLFGYKELALKVTNWGYVASVRTDRMKWLSHLLKHPLLQTEKSAFSFNAKILFHAIKAEIYKNLDDFEQSFTHTKLLLQLFYQNADYSEIEWSSFLDALNSHANMAIQLGKYDDAIITSDFMKQMSGIYAFVETHQLYCDIAIRYHLIDLKLCKETFRFGEAPELIQKTEQCLQKSVILIDYFYVASTLTEIAQIHFLMGNYKAAVDCCLRIYSTEVNCPNETIQTWAKMLHALALIETRSKEALKAMNYDMQHYFKEIKIYLRFEILFVDMLKKLVQVLGNATHELKILKDYEILFDSVRSSNEKYIHVLIIQWINSKLQKKSMVQLLQERASRTIISKQMKEQTAARAFKLP